jgi:hypothetical protein
MKPADLISTLRAAADPLHLLAADALITRDVEIERLRARALQLESVARLNGETIRSMQEAAREPKPSFHNAYRRVGQLEGIVKLASAAVQYQAGRNEELNNAWVSLDLATAEIVRLQNELEAAQTNSPITRRSLLSHAGTGQLHEAGGEVEEPQGA